MELQKLKRGTIRKIEDHRITLMNLDGKCEDSFPIDGRFADEMRTNIQPNEAVFYVTEGDQLLGIGLEEAAPDDLKMLYDVMLKEKECSYWPKKPEKQGEDGLIREVYHSPLEE